MLYVRHAWANTELALLQLCSRDPGLGPNGRQRQRIAERICLLQ